MSVRLLIVDGIEIPVWASKGLRQSIDPVEARFRPRMRSGTALQRIVYTGKYKTEISGNGFAPSGLQSLDTTDSFDIWCVASIGKNSASNIIDISSNRRADAGSEPFGFAVVDQAMVSTPVSMSVDQATLTVVAGATAYQVRWFPILTVFADPVEEELGRGDGYSWRLSAEEV